jgi:hypothetical protein
MSKFHLMLWYYGLKVGTFPPCLHRSLRLLPLCSFCSFDGLSMLLAVVRYGL